MKHEARFRYVGRDLTGRLVTVTCRCGWVGENHRSRGEAFRAFQGHVWLVTHRRTRAVFGLNAHRSKPF